MGFGILQAELLESELIELEIGLELNLEIFKLLLKSVQSGKAGFTYFLL